MRTGRPPLPKLLHQLHGNPSKKRLDDVEEPVTRGPLGPPPDDLDQGARQAWLELEESMPIAVLASCDLPMVSAYCTAVARHREAVVALRETGGSVFERDGILVRNPWGHIVDKQAMLIAKFAGELALTPTARAAMAARVAAAGGSMATEDRRPRSALDLYLDEKPDKLEPN